MTKRRNNSAKNKKRRTDAQWARLVGKKYLDELNLIVDDLFERAYRKKWNWAQLAAKSGLAIQTVRRLGHGETRLPQYRTLVMLADALGGQLIFKTGNRVTLKITWTPEKMDGRRKRQPDKDLKVAA